MDRRAAGALLALAACIACSAAAPTVSDHTALDLYDGTSEGCYYNFQHYGEGDRIMTNEPCLNCTCHNKMLMCYLRVCPFTKPIGQDCTVEKRADQCCPIVTCPDVPVDLLTSTSTTSPAEYGATGIGKLDKYGCTINEKYFPEGSKVPPTPNKPCEHCYCIRNMTTCVMQECTLHVDGCTPIYHKDVCCPVRYSCDHPEEEILLLDDMTTTVRPTPGFLLTTTTISPVTQMTQDCIHDDRVFADGALIKTEKACEHCYCMKGDIVCVVQECGTPMENEGKNCSSLPPREGQCCPDTYICEGDEQSTELPSDVMIQEEMTTLAPPRRVGVEGSGYRNEPDEAPQTESSATEIEMEGSGEEQPNTLPEVDTSDVITPETATPSITDEYLATTEKGQQYVPITAVPPKSDEIGVSTQYPEPSHGFNIIPSEVPEDVNTVPEHYISSTTVGPTKEEKHIPSTTTILVQDVEISTTKTIDGQDLLPGTISEKESSELDQFIPISTSAPLTDLGEKDTTEQTETEDIIPSITAISSEQEQNIPVTTSAPFIEESKEPSTEPAEEQDVKPGNAVEVETEEPEEYISITTHKPRLEETETSSIGQDVSESDAVTEKKHSEIDQHISSTNLPEIDEGDMYTTETIDGHETSGTITEKESEPELIPVTTTIPIIHETEKESTRPSIISETITEKEGSIIDQFNPITTSLPTVDDYDHLTTKLSGEKDMSPGVVETTDRLVPEKYIPKTTTSPIVDKEEENTTTISHEESLVTEHFISRTTVTSLLEVDELTTVTPNQDQYEPDGITEKEISKPQPTGAPAYEENEKTTVGIDKEQDSIVGITSKEQTLESESPKSTEPTTSIKETAGGETTAIAFDSSSTSQEESYIITTEATLRKEDSIVSNDTQKPLESTTVKTESITESVDIETKPTILASVEDQKTTKEDEIKEPIESTTTAIVKEDEKEPFFVTEEELVPTTPAADKLNLPETTTINIGDNEIHEDSIITSGRIPGEGDCLLNGITYRNETIVPSTNNCHIGCRCISSIIKCEPVICSPPPEYMNNCQPTYDSSDSCCPTYVCDHSKETIPPESQSQMSGTESPISPPAIECRGDQCEISEEKVVICTSDDCLKEPSAKPESVDCGLEDCSHIQTPTQPQPVEHSEECEAGKCEPSQESCANGKCQLPPIVEQALPVKPCEGDHCEEKLDESIIPQVPIVSCDDGSGDCSSTIVSLPQDAKKDVKCTEENGCQKPQDETKLECVGESCRRKGSSDIDTKLPSPCVDSECTQQIPTQHSLDTDISITKSPEEEKGTLDTSQDSLVTKDQEAHTDLPTSHAVETETVTSKISEIITTETYVSPDHVSSDTDSLITKTTTVSSLVDLTTILPISESIDFGSPDDKLQKNVTTELPQTEDIHLETTGTAALQATTKQYVPIISDLETELTTKSLVTENQDIYTEIPLSPTEKPNDAKTETTLSPAEKPHDVETETPVAPAEEPHGGEAESPLSPAEEPHGGEAESPLSPAEEPHDAETETPLSPAEEPHDVETESPVSPAEEPHDVDVEPPLSPVEEPHDLETVSPLSPAEKPHDVETESPLSPVEETHEIETETTMSPAVEPHDVETESPLSPAEEPHDVETESPLSPAEKPHDIETESPLSPAEEPHDVETESSLSSSEKPHEVETESTLSIAEELHTVETESPLSPAEKPHDVETESPLPPAEEPHDVETESPLSPAEEPHTVETESPLSPAEKPHDVETESPLSPAEEPHDVEIESPLSPAEEPHTVETESPLSPAEKPLDVETESPLSPAEKPYDVETESPLSPAEEPHDVETESPLSPAEEPHDVETESPLSPAEKPHDVETESPLSPAEEPHDVETESPLSPADKPHDVETESPSSHADEPHDLETETPLSSTEKQHDFDKLPGTDQAVGYTEKPSAGPETSDCGSEYCSHEETLTHPQSVDQTQECKDGKCEPHKESCANGNCHGPSIESLNLTESPITQQPLKTTEEHSEKNITPHSSTVSGMMESDTDSIKLTDYSVTPKITEFTEKVHETPETQTTQLVDTAESQERVTKKPEQEISHTESYVTEPHKETKLPDFSEAVQPSIEITKSPETSVTESVTETKLPISELDEVSTKLSDSDAFKAPTTEQYDQTQEGLTTSSQEVAKGSIKTSTQILPTLSNDVVTEISDILYTPEIETDTDSTMELELTTKATLLTVTTSANQDKPTQVILEEHKTELPSSYVTKAQESFTNENEQPVTEHISHTTLHVTVTPFAATAGLEQQEMITEKIETSTEQEIISIADEKQTYTESHDTEPQKISPPIITPHEEIISHETLIPSIIEQKITTESMIPISDGEKIKTEPPKVEEMDISTDQTGLQDGYGLISESPEAMVTEEPDQTIDKSESEISDDGKIKTESPELHEDHEKPSPERPIDKEVIPQYPGQPNLVEKEDYSTEIPVHSVTEQQTSYTESMQPIVTEKEHEELDIVTSKPLISDEISKTGQHEANSENLPPSTNEIQDESTEVPAMSSEQQMPTKSTEISSSAPQEESTDEERITTPKESVTIKYQEDEITDKTPQTEIESSDPYIPVHKEEPSTGTPIVQETDVSHKVSKPYEESATEQYDISTKQTEFVEESYTEISIADLTKPQELVTKAPEIAITEEAITKLPDIVTDDSDATDDSKSPITEIQNTFTESPNIAEDTHTETPLSLVTEAHETKKPEDASDHKTTKLPGISDIEENEIHTEIVSLIPEKTESSTKSVELPFSETFTTESLVHEVQTNVPEMMLTESQILGSTEKPKGSTTLSEEMYTEKPSKHHVTISEQTETNSSPIITENESVMLTTESSVPLVTEAQQITTKQSESQEISTELQNTSTDIPKKSKPDEQEQYSESYLPVTTESQVGITKISEIVTEQENVTMIPDQLATEKSDTMIHSELHETKEPVETGSKLPEENIVTTSDVAQVIYDTPESTPYLIELEEHTHKREEELSTTIIPELTTRNIDTQQEQKVSEITTEKPTVEENPTSDADIIPVKEDETISSVDSSHPSDEVYEKTTQSLVLLEETPSLPTTSELSASHDVDDKNITEPSTSSPLIIEKEHTTLRVPADTGSSIQDLMPTEQTDDEKETISEKPLESDVPYVTTSSEEVLITTLKTTTSQFENAASQTPAPIDKYTKTEEKPSEMMPSTTAPELSKPGSNEIQPTDEVPEEKPSEMMPSTTAPELSKPGSNEIQPTDDVPTPEDGGQIAPSGTSGYGPEPDYFEEDQTFGPGTCRYGGKVYVSAQQIPRDDPCDFCFCFRSDIICLQQSCPPPIHGCHEEPIQGFCCPRYECPVSMATTLNVTTTTTTTTTTLPPHFPTHPYKGAAQRRGCQIKGHTYKVGEVVRASSGPCLHCTCGGDGQMKCDPKACTPEPMLRQMIAAAVSAKRRR